LPRGDFFAAAFVATAFWAGIDGFSAALVPTDRASEDGCLFMAAFQ
jgi:hypothetical protein